VLAAARKLAESKQVLGAPRIESSSLVRSPAKLAISEQKKRLDVADARVE